MSQVSLSKIANPKDHTFAVLIASCYGYIDTVMMNGAIRSFREFEGLHPKEPKRSKEITDFYLTNNNQALADRLRKVFEENKDAFPTIDKLIVDPNFAN